MTIPLNPRIKAQNIKIVNKPKDWQTLRTSVLKRDKSRCRHCGKQYKSYLFCEKVSHKPGSLGYGLRCQMCYRVTHFDKVDFLDQMVLCWSNMDQREIVAQTVDFIKTNDRVPNIEEIDNDVKMVPLSLVEFADILNKYLYRDLPDELKNLKIFFTHELDLKFLGKGFNAKDDYNHYVDGYSEEYEHYQGLDEYYEDLEDRIPTYEFTEGTQIFLNTYFNQ